MKKFKKNDYFILYSNCIPVRGASRSLICDLQNGNYLFIPNDLYDILIKTKTVKMLDLLEKFSKDDIETIYEYIEYLISNKLGFIDEEVTLFPELDLHWDKPSEITNSIIDFKNDCFLKIDYKSILLELSNLNCSCIQFRCFEASEPKLVKTFLVYMNNTRIKEARFVLKYNPILESSIKEFITNFNRITEVIFYGCEKPHISDYKGVKMIYIRADNLSVQNCGNVCQKAFVVNLDFFTEAQKFNTCLNRKISIDVLGNIKNCPSQTKSFGNVMNSSISNVLKNDENFKTLWSISKDEVEVCKDCEFRYICTDCRVFTKTTNVFSKPSKCNYDPYSATWN